MRRYLYMMFLCLAVAASVQAQKPGKQPDGLPVQSVGEDAQAVADSLSELLGDTIFDETPEET